MRGPDYIECLGQNNPITYWECWLKDNLLRDRLQASNGSFIVDRYVPDSLKGSGDGYLSIECTQLLRMDDVHSENSNIIRVNGEGRSEGHFL